MESGYCAVGLSLIKTNYVSACHRGGPGSITGLSLGDLCEKIGTGKGFSQSISSFSCQYHSPLLRTHCSIHISIYTLLLPEGEMGEAWKPSKRQCCFGSQGALDRKALFTFFVPKGLIRQVADTCEYSNELSGSINAGNFLTSCKTS
jgi:hypothetical protein